MKSKIIKTILLILGLVVWIGAFNLIFYTKDLNYSQIAVNQVDNDSTYTLLKTQNAATPILDFVNILVILLILFFIAKIWYTTAKEAFLKYEN